MLYIRSLFCNVAFYVVLIIFLIGGLPVFLLPHKPAMWALKLWAKSAGAVMRLTAGINVEIRGAQYLNDGPLLIASKHQSLWETFALLPLFRDPAVILKKELTYIPLFGWFALKFNHITVDRSAGSAALRAMLDQARKACEDNRQIVIFPEGTRKAPGAEPDYKPGVAALYKATKIPCVPVALNSGLYWPRRSFIRHPGTIIVEFLPPIAPGLNRKEFMQKVETEIETATTRLVAEGRAADFS